MTANSAEVREALEREKRNQKIAKKRFTGKRIAKETKIAGKLVREKEPRGQDERLLVEAAQRDPRCFGELYELHFHRVYAYAVKRLPSREEAEDVTSVVFHQALAKIKSYEWRGVPFSAWLIRIAANAVADRWKHAAREGGDVADDLKDDVADANAEDVEQRAVLFQLVDGLPAEQRRVVVLRFVEQKSIREIAGEMRKTEGAVKQLQFRALQKLRAQMEGADA